MTEPIINSESRPHLGDTFVMTFAGPIFLDRLNPPHDAYEFRDEPAGFVAKITAPKRTRPIGWIATPPMTRDGLSIVDPGTAAMEAVPQSIAMDAGFNHQGQLTFYFDAENAFHEWGQFSADTISVSIIGLASQNEREVVASDIFFHLMRQVRVKTLQFRAGRLEGSGQSPIRTVLQMSEETRYNGIISAQSDAAFVYQLEAYPLSHEMFLAAVSDVKHGRFPSLAEEAHLDVAFQSARDNVLLTVVLACSAAELMRDDVFKAFGKQVRNTDVLRHLSTDLEKMAGRNLKTEMPKEFAMLESAWIARGHIAHGKPFFWKADPSLTRLPAEFAATFRDIMFWLEGLLKSLPG